MRLKAEIAVVTGAAGGIGAATAALFAHEGATVIGLDRIPKTQGVPCLEVDLASDAAVRDAAERIARDFGDPTIVVHAAAVSEFAQTLESSTAAFSRIFDVNVNGAVRLAQAFAPAMRKCARGAFVFVSSINGIVGAPGLAAYATSKGALNTLTRTLALELAPDNVRVNCICPASVDTPLLQASFNRHPDPEAARALNIRRHPLGRLGTPQDIANLALFLSSQESAWITGGTYLIDGGASLARRWQE